MMLVLTFFTSDLCEAVCKTIIHHKLKELHCVSTLHLLYPVYHNLPPELEVCDFEACCFI